MTTETILPRRQNSYPKCICGGLWEKLCNSVIWSSCFLLLASCARQLSQLSLNTCLLLDLDIPEQRWCSFVTVMCTSRPTYGKYLYLGAVLWQKVHVLISVHHFRV